MTSIDIIVLVVTIVCLVSFCSVFTILFNHYYKSNIEAVSSGKEDIALIDNAIDEEKMKNSKARKILKLIGKIISYVVLGGVFLIFIISLIGKISGDSIVVGNSTMVVIASGSMSEKNSEFIKSHPEYTNQFNTYDIIGITKYDKSSDVKIGDVVAYKNKNNITIVHRVINSKVSDDGSTVVYLTQGDSNTASDVGSQYNDYLSYDKIIGYYNGKRIKGIGIFVIFLQSSAGVVTVISVIYCLVMFDYLSNKYKKAIADRTNQLVKLIDYDLSTPSDGNLVTKYHETLLYKDSVYSFEDGKFIGKNDKNDKGFDSHMVLIKNENGTNTVSVTDTRTNETKVYENVPDEKIKDPSVFIEEDDEVTRP